MIPRVAVLVDLSREATAGGHVKYWEGVAHACVETHAPVNLTVYFSGTGDDVVLSPRVRFRFLPPVFSTSRIPFLPYTPAHTDLASFHSALAKELVSYDVIHTTDAYFAFAQTAEKIAAQKNIPLVTSFHTDTPSYAEVFTRETMASLLGKKLGGFIDRAFRLSLRERKSKEKRCQKHLLACDAVLAMRADDKAIATALGKRVDPMRLGVDRAIFKPDDGARHKVGQVYAIPPDALVALFVGRVDVGKNMPLLLDAVEKAIGLGENLHLLVAGLGPCCVDVSTRLGSRATLAGHVSPQNLATLYAASDVLCMASDIEIGGLIGAEALACGCPVLVSQSSGVADLYGLTEAVQSVASNADSWAAALSALARDRATISARHEAAVLYGQQRVADWGAVVCDDFLPVWQRVVKKEQT